MSTAGRPERSERSARQTVGLLLAILVVLGCAALILGAFLVGRALDSNELGIGLGLVVGGLLAVVAGLRLDLL